MPKSKEPSLFSCPFFLAVAYGTEKTKQKAISNGVTETIREANKRQKEMINKRQYTNFLFLVVAIFDYWLHYKILITDNCYYMALLIMSLIITALLGSSLSSLIHNYIINFVFRVFKISLYCYCILSLVLLFMSYKEPTIMETAKLVSISTFRTDMISFDFNNKQYSIPYNISNYCDTKDYDNFINSHKVEMHLKQPLPGAYIICDLVLSQEK